MAPGIPDGARAFACPVRPDRIRAGDVILFRRRGRIVAHRVAARARVATGHLFLEIADAGGRPTVVPEDAVVGRIERFHDGNRTRPVPEGARTPLLPRLRFALHAILRGPAAFLLPGRTARLRDRPALHATR